MSETLFQRNRRLRVNPTLRALVAENHIQPQDMVKPVFVHKGSESIPIPGLPNSKILTSNDLVKEVKRLKEIGILGINLYPSLQKSEKDLTAKEALNPNGIIPHAIKAIKDAVPDFLVIPDVALNPYTSHGHDGITNDEGRILNDESIKILAEQSVLLAKAGADIIAPSDMFDGRTLVIRQALDAHGYKETPILAYAAKYASSYYGLFRVAVGNKDLQKVDKKSYQIEPCNILQALAEVKTDLLEGADIIMIKPAGHYLDVVAKTRALTDKPIAVFQISGECAQLRLMAEHGLGDEKAMLYEQLISMKRAGADMIFSYFAETLFL